MSENKYEFDKEELDKFPEFKPNEQLKFIVGDLFQAKQDLIRYELGEIASINNLLAGSYLKMKNFHEEQIESSFYEEDDYETEKTTKSQQSSQQMMSEVSRNTVSQSNSFSAGGDVSGSYGTINFNAYADSNNNQSQQQSTESAQSFANQVINSSEEKVRERRLTQSYSRNLEIIREEQDYGFDNRGGSHVVGIKRFVNEIHKVTLLNHKKYLFSTIILAHPSEHYKKLIEVQEGKDEKSSKEAKEKSLYYGEDDDGKPVILTLDNITRENWDELAFYFGVESEDLPIPPEKKISIISSVDIDSGSNEVIQDVQIVKFSIPAGYIPLKIKHSNDAVVKDSNTWGIRLFLSGVWEDIKPNDANSDAKYGEVVLEETFTDDSGNIVIQNIFTSLNGEKDNFHVGFGASNIYDQGVICTVFCELSDESIVYKSWKLDFYNVLKNSQKTNEETTPGAFLDNLGVGKVDFKNNPSLARKLIDHELQRSVLQQVFGSDLEGFSVLDRETIEGLSYPDCDLKKLNTLSPLLSFLSKVFDFDKMSYRFLKNYLGAKWNRDEIYSGTRLGPLKEFLEASFAEMILPVQHGMEHRFRFFMLTNGIVYEGEDVPVIDDEISLGILDELSKENTNADEEPIIVSETEISLPSPHIILQENGVLPDFGDPSIVTGPVTEIEPKKGEEDEAE